MARNYFCRENEKDFLRVTARGSDLVMEVKYPAESDVLRTIVLDAEQRADLARYIGGDIAPKWEDV